MASSPLASLASLASLLPCLLLLLPSLALRLEEGTSCSQPLGLQDGSIRDNQLTASSSYQDTLVGPAKARLNSELGGGAWCPRSPVAGIVASPEWIQVDLEAEHVISGLVTQGRFAHGLGQEYAELFLVQYWMEGQEVWQDYRDQQGTRLLQGNTNTFSPVEISLKAGPIVASKIRILPFSHHPRTVCVRLELLGCKYTGNFFGVLTLGHQDNDTSLQPFMQSDDWNEATFLGAAVGILVTVSIAALAAVVLVLVRNRDQRKSLAAFSRYDDTHASRSTLPRVGADSSQGSLPSQASYSPVVPILPGQCLRATPGSPATYLSTPRTRWRQPP